MGCWEGGKGWGKWYNYILERIKRIFFVKGNKHRGNPERVVLPRRWGLPLLLTAPSVSERLIREWPSHGAIPKALVKPPS